jgi:hypothetical protein
LQFGRCDRSTQYLGSSRPGTGSTFTSGAQLLAYREAESLCFDPAMPTKVVGRAKDNAARLQLFALAFNLANFLQ